MTIRFKAAVKLQAADGKPRRLSIVGYTGGPMRVSGFGVIVVDLAGLEIPSNVTVLADHDSTLAGVIGAGVATVSGGRLLVSATLAETEAANTVVSLLESGVALQASLGADPVERRTVSDRETVKVNGKDIAGPFTLISKSTLREMTVCPLGADDQTSVELAAKAAKGGSMFKAMLKAAKASGNEDVQKYSDEAIDKMTEEEAKAALKSCMKGESDQDEEPASAKALVEIMSMADTPRSLQDQAANEGWSERRCRQEVLAFRRASRPGPNVGRSAVTADHGNSEGVIMSAIMMRAGSEAIAVKAYGERAAYAARESGLHRAPFSEIFAAHLRANNIDPGPRRDIEGMIRASGTSNASLANLLSNTLNKMLEQQWPQSPGTWRAWCATRPVKDFKPAKSLRPVFNGNMSPLPEAGEIKHGNLTDSMIEYQLSSFAKMFTIGRQTLINDDLSGLSELPMGLILMADRAVSDLVYYTLLSNPSNFYATGNGNNQTSGSSALSSSSLALAIRQMRLQRGPNTAPLSIPPETLVVPPELEQVAKEILNSSWVFRDQTLDRQGSGNPLEKAVKLEVEPRLSLGATSPITGATANGVPAQWFVFASPAYLPAVVGFLNGSETPQVQMADPLGFNFDVPGQSWRCIYDFGFALGDYRASQRAVGS